MQDYSELAGKKQMDVKLLRRVRRWQARGERGGLGGGWLYLGATGKLCLAHKPNLHAAQAVLMRIDGTSIRRYHPTFPPLTR